MKVAAQLAAVLVVAGLAAYLTMRLVHTYRRARSRWRRVVLAFSFASGATSPQWWIVQRARRSMWRAVTTAERAVQAARDTGVPVGDLPSVTHRLSATARTVDSGLRAATSGSRLPTGLLRQAREITAAAQDVADAAGASFAADAAATTASVVDAARTELQALRSGWAAGAVGRGR